MTDQYESKVLPSALRGLAMDEKNAIVRNVLNHSAEALERLSISHACYETLRMCDPRSFGELYAQNLAGRRFDDLVDELIARQPMEKT